jgi:uncharacterized protein YjbI with pentapeptide repeats
LNAAYFVDASLTNANLSRTSDTREDPANFTGAELSGINMQSALTNGVFDSATLVGADFSRATVRRANFTNANLLSANFRNANMSLDIKDRGANFSGITCPDGRITPNPTIGWRWFDFCWG